MVTFMARRSLADEVFCPIQGFQKLLLLRIRAKKTLNDRVRANTRGEESIRRHAVLHPLDQRVKGGVRVRAGATDAVVQTWSEEETVEVVYIRVEFRDALVVVHTPTERNDFVGLNQGQSFSRYVASQNRGVSWTLDVLFRGM